MSYTCAILVLSSGNILICCLHLGIVELNFIKFSLKKFFISCFICRDGTTDITRTVHFGTPTEYEKECFTRVFKGQASLATAVFPQKIKVL